MEHTSAHFTSLRSDNCRGLNLNLKLIHYLMLELVSQDQVVAPHLKDTYESLCMPKKEKTTCSWGCQLRAMGSKMFGSVAKTQHVEL